MIGRELVYSRRYDANRKSVETSRLYIHMVLVKKRAIGGPYRFKGVMSAMDFNLKLAMELK